MCTHSDAIFVRTQILPRPSVPTGKYPPDILVTTDCIANLNTRKSMVYFEESQ